MALTKPILYSITSFDATTSETIKFNVIGGNQVVANKLVIQRNDDLSVVYNSKQSTFKYEHNIPSNTLTNGVLYQAYIQTYDVSGNVSVQSNIVNFACYETPSVVFDNIPVGGKIENNSYRFTVTYNQANNDYLNAYSFNLYDVHGDLISTSNLQYTTEKKVPLTIGHLFTGFDNNSEYRIEFVGETDSGMPVVSTDVNIITSFVQESIFSNVTLTNECKGGYIVFNSKISAIDGYSPTTPIYIDNNSIDLRGDTYVEWRDGYQISNSFTARIWGRDFNYGNKIASFRTTLGDEISVYLYENENGVWAELYVTNIELFYSYAIKSAYVKLAKNDNAFIWIRHDNNLYDVIVSKYEGDII